MARFFNCIVVCWLSHLLVEETMETEYEESLETVEDGEDIGQGDGLLADIEVAKCPGETKQNFHRQGTL